MSVYAEEALKRISLVVAAICLIVSMWQGVRIGIRGSHAWLPLFTPALGSYPALLSRLRIREICAIHFFGQYIK